MANVQIAVFGAAGGGHRMDAALDGSPQHAAPRKAWFTLKLNSGVNITVDLITGKIGTPDRDPEDPAAVLLNQQDFSQAAPGPLLNTGPQTRTGVRASFSSNR